MTIKKENKEEQELPSSIYIKINTNEFKIEGKESFVKQMFDRVIDESIFKLSSISNQNEGTSQPNVQLEPNYDEQNPDEDDDIYNYISKRTDIPTNDLKLAVMIDDDIGIKFLKDINGNSDKEKKQKLAIMSLYLSDSMGDTWMKSSEIMDIAKKSNIPMSRVSQFLKDMSKHVVSSGSKRGRKFKLTRPGELKAKEYLQELCEK